jgi:hypothetical protein
MKDPITVVTIIGICVILVIFLIDIFENKDDNTKEE